MREQAQQEFESRGGMSRRLARPHRTIDSNSQAMVPHQYPSQHQTQHQQHDQTSWQVAGNAVAPLASFASAPQATIFVGLPLVSISQQQVSALSLISRAEQCVEEFGEYFGREVDDLDALQELCRVAGFVPPNTVGECVTVSQSTKDMLIWLIDHCKGAEPMPHEHVRCGGSWWKAWPDCRSLLQQRRDARLQPILWEGVAEEGAQGQSLVECADEEFQLKLKEDEMRKIRVEMDAATHERIEVELVKQHNK